MRNEVIATATLEDELLVLVAEEGMIDRARLTRDAKLDELDIASADFVMVLMAIEEKFGAYISVDNELSDMKTVGDLLDIATRKIADAQTA